MLSLTSTPSGAARHLLALLGCATLVACAPANPPADTAPARAALTVTLTQARTESWPLTLPSTGNIAAWQESVIGAEVANQRITEVRVQVGDRVAKGELMARIADDTAQSELRDAEASVTELTAAAEEAKANAIRARELRDKGFYSPQTALQSVTAENTANARLSAARARLEAAQIRLSKTQVLAPSNGEVSARNATVGSLTQAGQELFRLIRDGRLEWRAEVSGADLAKVHVGQAAHLDTPSGQSVAGKVRSIGISLDPNTRNALVYVDLDKGSDARAGMFARGTLQLGTQAAQTLPQAAIVMRDGFAYVFRMEGEQRVAQTKVSLGRRQEDRVEILAGLPADAQVVATGAGFLGDGDIVKVVQEARP